ncbi:flagellar export chaperone FlgN [Pseudarthrobacter sp. NBSH8]|uniref:flagellar export chaperone FlgN n=1 Tax=Pseudarthrobacter sp. NBSH8 TaxID=2596911 RepID=UPI0016235CB1|nr:flagellar export chaperone FlgN [Pseudarthrobacter sp. NBSH8]QNE15637.1 flagellar protein FlgN [Pseudarthrobacter sp. NBSH8]
MAIHELSALLWRERELLDLLTFKLEEEQLLLTAGKSRWLPHGTREVEQVLEHLSRAGMARAVEVAAVAQQWGLSADSSLSELATAAPDAAWAEVLSSHLKAMQRQTAAIQELRDSNEQFLRAAVRSTQETAADLKPAAGTYDAHGMTGETSPSRFFDQKL